MNDFMCYLTICQSKSAELSQIKLWLTKTWICIHKALKERKKVWIWQGNIPGKKK
jgi:hypothetical protein